MHLRSFQGNFGFHEKWTNGVFRGFSRQHKWYQAPTQGYKLRRHSLERFGKKYDQPRKKSKNVPKTDKIEGYNTRFWTFPGPKLRMQRDASYCHGRSLERSHVGWNAYVDAFTFISRQFCFSRELNKWGVQRLFEATQMVPSTRPMLQVTSAFIGTFLEKIWQVPAKSKNIPKTIKIEGYNIHFYSFPGSEFQTPQNSSWEHGRSLESNHVAWNEYVDAFTFISREFFFSREMNKWGVQRLFEATQLVPSTHPRLQVTSAFIGTFREKIWPGPKKSKNVPKNSQKLKL